MPNLYTESRKALDTAVRMSKKVILDTWKKYGDMTGRYYQPVEKYKTDGAETLLVTIGGYSENAMMTIDKLRDEGKKIGLVRPRLWRPFPYQEIIEALSGAKNVIVLDRAISLGGPAPVCSENQGCALPGGKKTANCQRSRRSWRAGYFPENFETIIRIGLEKAKAGQTEEIIMSE